MEIVLSVKSNRFKDAINEVLILVIVEIVLSEIQRILCKTTQNVLILVIVEIVLSGLYLKRVARKEVCLNPCYSGNCIE